MKNKWWRFFITIPAVAVIYVPILLLLIEFGHFPQVDYSLFTFGLGFISLWSGVILIIWSYMKLLKEGGAEINLRIPTKRLVKSGPYNIIRNPLYVGAIAVLLGEALYFDSMYVFLWAVLCGAVIAVYVVKIEEYRLANRFGQEYISYKMDVGRWCPKRHTIEELLKKK